MAAREITRAELNGVLVAMVKRKRGVLLYFPATLDEWQEGPEEWRYNSAEGQVYYIERYQAPTVADVLETLHGVKPSDDDPAPSDRCARPRRALIPGEPDFGHWCDGSCDPMGALVLGVGVADLYHAQHPSPEAMLALADALEAALDGR